MRDSDHTGPLAYYDEHYRRDAAPLLDELAAVIDHVEAYSRGGRHDSVENFATACNKCNTRKSDRASTVLPSPRRIKAKYGEPAHWDGFSELFLVLGQQFPTLLTTADRDWRKALLKSREQRREGQEAGTGRSEEHTSELQSPCNLVCRLLLEKKKKNTRKRWHH